MATAYPTALDTSTQQPSPSASTEMDDSGYEHDVVHANHSGAIIALETKLGIGATTAAGASTNQVLVKQGDGDTEWAAAPTVVPTTITVADTTNTTCSVALFESATGDLAPKTDAGATYNAATGVLTATGFAGPLTGNVTGDASGSSGSCTGNAATATNSTTVTVADTTDTTCSVALFESATGSLGAKTDAGATYNAGTGTLTATAFAGPLTGNVTGNASGTAATVTGAAQSAITSVGTMTGLVVDGTSQLYESVIEAIPGNKTPALGDAGKVFHCSQVGGTQTITIDGSISWPVGTQMVFVASNTSTVTFAESNSTSLDSKDDNKSIDGRYASAALINYGSNTWFLIGALA